TKPTSSVFGLSGIAATGWPAVGGGVTVAGGVSDFLSQATKARAVSRLSVRIDILALQRVGVSRRYNAASSASQPCFRALFLVKGAERLKISRNRGPSLPRRECIR